ncbi:LCP family protein required for cell wall assembly [Nocardiopsis mwathae]|uniref:LCP family protein required for cell wall assembly n=1 Tax=Nocardiopsis mwathae TaxID=1472723 RepID=A0A7X0D912_9ACTN|nr:LCP family protein [Nocardiopsis mwathae]MBB6174574.1 LCP family protein required for cell wall assembly [Nocardiopsis mwathae]
MSDDAANSSEAEPSAKDTPPQDAEPATEATTASASAAAGSGPRSRLGRRLATGTAIALALALVAGIGTAYAYYRFLQGNMTRHDLGSTLSDEERPEKIGDAVNILFIGSDGRQEGNSDYGGRDFAGERSDSLMLAHISPDSRVTVINIPRDSLVQLPQCAPYGETEGTQGYYGMINSALFHGGPPCVIKTVETLTGIRIDHFVHLSFVGFRDMVDAVGGVRMCIPEPMSDRRAKLDLDAGDQRLDGEQALAFVRARYEIGDGGDIGRIDRQQMFLGALAEEVTGSGVLTSPAKINGLLQAITEHTATDRDFSLSRMVSIGATLADVDLHDIAFYTVPWFPAPSDPNRVVWDEEKAQRLFAAVSRDQRVDDSMLETGAPSSPSGEPSPLPEPSYPAEPSTEPVTPSASSSPSPTGGEIEGRDATANPCVNGLGEGTEGK